MNIQNLYYQFAGGICVFWYLHGFESFDIDESCCIKWNMACNIEHASRDGFRKWTLIHLIWKNDEVFRTVPSRVMPRAKVHSPELGIRQFSFVRYTC